MSRNQSFLRPPSNLKTYLDTARDFPLNAFLVHRGEHEQMKKLIETFHKENPNANQNQKALAKIFFITYLQLLRLLDRRCFFDGTETAATRIDCYYLELSEEATRRKEREMKEWYFSTLRSFLDQCKICMANSIQINVGSDIESLFSLNQTDKEKLSASA